MSAHVQPLSTVTSHNINAVHWHTLFSSAGSLELNCICPAVKWRPHPLIRSLFESVMDSLWCCKTTLETTISLKNRQPRFQSTLPFSRAHYIQLVSIISTENQMAVLTDSYKNLNKPDKPQTVVQLLEKKLVNSRKHSFMPRKHYCVG